MIYMILAEATAAKQKAEFDKLLTKKEFQRVEMEAEEERKRQFQRAEFECDKAILTAMKKAAIAETKLKAIKQAIEEGKAEQDTLTTISHLYEPTDTPSSRLILFSLNGKCRGEKLCLGERGWG